MIPQEKVRFLAFDCLVIDDFNVMDRPLDKRYGVRASLFGALRDVLRLTRCRG